jgi:seryl-tRNA synthetase
MLDIRKIRENPDFYRERLALRHAGDEKLIDHVLSLDAKRRRLVQETDTKKSQYNFASKVFGRAIKTGLDDLSEEQKTIDALSEHFLKGFLGKAAQYAERIKTVGLEIAQLDQELAGIETEQHELLLRIPNITHDSVPAGKGPEENRIERVVGKPAEFNFKPKPHWEIGTQLGLLDFEAATKIAGSGFVVFKGLGARLERALISYLLDLHTTEHGYTEVSPPFLVRAESMTGTSQFPKFIDQQYAVTEEPPLYLVPTAEVPVTNLHREEILAADRLPIRYAAYTPCFRREAGAAGVGTRGLIRVHQFDKVELVHIVTPEQSYAALETLVGHAERVLRDLGLHYRVVSLCTGDIGFGAAKCYDVEVWAPGVGAWLEVSSCSNFEDFQARRMNLRYKNSEGKNIFCHTLNGSGLALPRLYVALLETYQQADGHVLIPEPLRPYLGGLKAL